MPIKPENRSRYPRNWREIRARILERAGHRCEWCDVQNYAMRGATRIVITIAHLDHQPENNSPVNLRALCQRCHLGHDRPHHLAVRRARRAVV